jgi:hypothetical protein
MWSLEMSDNLNEKFATGNFAGSPRLQGRMDKYFTSYPVKRRLAEECSAFSMADLRKIYKRKELLRLADEYQPAKFRLEGQRFSLYVIGEILPLPKRSRRTQNDTIRIWLMCPACFRRIRKVYTFPLAPGSPILAELKCYHCHQLTYKSKNSSGNLWWANFAMPLKRLLRHRQRLLSGRSLRSIAKLEKIDQSIWLLRERAATRKRSSRGISHNARRKRPYRDLSLIQ